MRAAVLAVLLIACGDNLPGNIQIRSPETFRAALDDYATTTAYPLSVVAEDGPAGDGFTITIITDPAIPAQSFQLAKLSDSEIAVATSDVLGAQYGTTAALEAMGFRFRHPYDIFVPERVTIGDVDDELHRPEIRVRGLQLHTLHPIEPYFAFWEPSPQNLADAKRIIDWVVKSRGNYLQWVALDDILDPTRHAAWKAHTQEIIRYAHVRGVRVGLNIQLFGAANLQLAYDLVDDVDGDIAGQIADRLGPITTDLDFDVYDLSFGEFFNSDPQFFIDSVNEVARQLGDVARRAEMHALIHVGADQIVKFNGEELIYYFLVKFADTSIIPDVHTVMFYNLYEPTGGAYHHEDFSAHREFLLERMCSGQPVAYQPETSYWVAFDNSVPHYFPIYVHNRWLDLDMLDKEPGCGKLDNHMLFTTGWEWGYWLHDYTALRASYEKPAEPRDLIAHAFGSDMGNAVDVVTSLIEAQREHLMLGRLVQYIAGRDTAIDAGRRLDIVSQPDRITFDDLVSGAHDLDQFVVEVLEPLQEHDLALGQIEDLLESAKLEDNRWTRELRDGIAINRLRVKFAIAINQAVVSHLEGGTDARAQFELAGALLEQGKILVGRRHADLHDGLGAKLIEATTNKTFYQFGYLFMADTLCYWEREFIQAGAILDAVSEPVPSCLF